MNNSLCKSYILEYNPTTTLNSGFFLELYLKQYNFEDYLPFPQRIPQIRFFNEMKVYAGAGFSVKFEKVISKIIFEINDIIILN